MPGAGDDAPRARQGPPRSRCIAARLRGAAGRGRRRCEHAADTDGEGAADAPAGALLRGPPR
eukprot:12557490-Heterocapsa_arctica.AAC.1